MEMTREQIECPHGEESEQRHWFEFEHDPKRNVWNPYEPTCTKCGVSIRDIVRSHAALRTRLAACERELKDTELDLEQCPECGEGHRCGTQQQLATAQARVTELEERLEIGFGYNQRGERVAVPKNGPDGIECRDVTIRCQDEHIADLQAQLQQARKRIAELEAQQAGS
jgi:chromosome segregation ATPase